MEAIVMNLEDNVGAVLLGPLTDRVLKATQ